MPPWWGYISRDTRRCLKDTIVTLGKAKPCLSPILHMEAKCILLDDKLHFYVFMVAVACKMCHSGIPPRNIVSLYLKESLKLISRGSELSDWYTCLVYPPSRLGFHPAYVCVCVCACRQGGRWHRSEMCFFLECSPGVWQAIWIEDWPVIPVNDLQCAEI